MARQTGAFILAHIILHNLYTYLAYFQKIYRACLQNEQELPMDYRKQKDCAKNCSVLVYLDMANACRHTKMLDL